MQLALLVNRKNAAVIQALSGIEIVPEVDEETVKYFIWSEDSPEDSYIMDRDAFLKTHKLLGAMPGFLVERI